MGKTNIPIDNGLLMRERAKDFAKFVEAQNNLINTEFGGKRIRKKRPQLLTLRYAGLMRDGLENSVRRVHRTSHQIANSPRIDPDADAALIVVNLKIIEELGRKVDGVGSKLVVVDASQYFGDDERVSSTLEELCATHGIGYIPLYNELLKAKHEWGLDAMGS